MAAKKQNIGAHVIMYHSIPRNIMLNCSMRGDVLRIRLSRNLICINTPLRVESYFLRFLEYVF